MEVETKEQVSTEEEQEEPTESSEAEAEEQTEVSETDEGKGESKTPKLSEEERQAIIKEEYAKWQSKTLTPISKDRDELRKQVEELNARLEDRSDNKELDLLLKADIDELGEDEAKKLDEVRRKYQTKLREYRDNANKVEKQVKDNESIAEKLGGIERKQTAVARAYEILLPNEKSFRNQLESIVSELEQAESPEHLERLAKLIIRERQGSQKSFKPDSGRNSGSGAKKGRKPTLDELRASHPDETQKKVASGEWIL